MKKALLTLAVAALLLLAICVQRAWRLSQVEPIAPTDFPTVIVPAKSAIARLRGALKIPTVSAQGPAELARFDEFNAYLQSRFPRLFARLEVSRFGGHSMLLHWPGTDPEAPATLLLAHSDVVPIADEKAWTHPPFAGVITEEHIWGRGALDDKASVLAILEALVSLNSERFKPRRSIFVAIGHDEEIGGRQGAATIAAHLREAGVSIGLALDEGGAITEGIVPGTSGPVASLMLAEKGYLSVELTARGEAGHSSLPGAQTAIGRLSGALDRVVRNPLPARLIPPVQQGLEALIPHRSWPERLVIANTWLFEGLLLGKLEETPVGNALIRTTTAPTMLRAGIKDNVLPAQATAILNFRLLPGDTQEAVLAHLRQAIDDPEVSIQPYGDFSSASSEVSSAESPYFRAVAAAVRQTLPQAIIHTGVVTGATDLRHYAGLYHTRINFLPTRLGPDDLPRIHGVDERIGIQDYLRMIVLYARIIQSVDGTGAG